MTYPGMKYNSFFAKCQLLTKDLKVVFQIDINSLRNDNLRRWGLQGIATLTNFFYNISSNFLLLIRDDSFLINSNFHPELDAA